MPNGLDAPSVAPERHQDAQMRLPWTSPAPAAPPVVDQRVPVQERDRLSAQSRRILERLREGPVQNRELAEMFPPGTAWRTRVADVRRWLRSRGETVTATDLGGGLYSYRIERL